MLFSYFPLVELFYLCCTIPLTLRAFTNNPFPTIREINGIIFWFIGFLIVLDDWIFFRWAKILWDVAIQRWGGGLTTKPVHVYVTDLNGQSFDIEHQVDMHDFNDVLREANQKLKEVLGIELRQVMTCRDQSQLFSKRLDAGQSIPHGANNIGAWGWIYPYCGLRKPLNLQVILLPTAFIGECYVIPPGIVVTSKDVLGTTFANKIIESAQFSYYMPKNNVVKPGNVVMGSSMWEKAVVRTHPVFW